MKCCIMPRPDARHFLERCAFVFSWGDLSDKVVLDVGCGDGENSTKLIVEMFPAVDQIIAIDTDSDMICDADYENRIENVYYISRDIQKWNEVKEWAYSIDIVISHFTFSYLDDQMTAFKNIYKLLRNGGTAGITFTLQSDKYDWLLEVSHLFNYFAPHLYMEPPETHKQSLSASHFQPLLEKIGFKVVQCDTVHYYHQFQKGEECKRELGLLCPLTPFVPGYLEEDFLNEIYEMYVIHNPINENGKVDFAYTAARIFLMKD